MDQHSFTANSAEEAIKKVREALGPEAVIDKVVKVQPDGLSRLWKGPRIQVFAHRPNSLPAERLESSPSSSVKSIPSRPSSDGSDNQVPSFSRSMDEQIEQASQHEWSVVEILQASGLLPQYAMRIMELIENRFGRGLPVDWRKQRQMIRLVLEESWRPYIHHQDKQGVIHLFVGAPGCGKTSVLCKWLTHHRLVGDKPVRAFQVNTDKFHVNSDQLALHCDILGIPLERFFPDTRTPSQRSEAWFVDVPGVDLFDRKSVEGVLQAVREFQSPEIHLVLNLAYETTVLLGHVMSCKKAQLPISSLIFTHMDEESRWGKIWNPVFAARLPISFFSTGQNIPGDFLRATSEPIIRQQFPS